MPLFEYYCDSCKVRFEHLSSRPPEELGRCPRCDRADHTRKLFSRFAIGGQGDLRESTIHGCHAGCGHDHGGGGSADNSDSET